MTKVLFCIAIWGQEFDESCHRFAVLLQQARALAVAKLKLGEAAQAIAALEQVPDAEQQALDLTYLAEALLTLGDAKLAEQTATDAIDELDSIHGRSWIVRAEARRLLGDIDGAAKDYNEALSASDEPGIEQRALDGLAAIDRPVEEDME
jgi:tetratricopeptide (TPR) repeat protein